MQASVESSTLSSPHLDLVSAVAFNPLGSHLATASLDHHVRVVHPSPTNPGAWDFSPRTWKAHDGAVLSLAWADSEFGTVFATGGVDGVVKIWRQDEPPPRPGQYVPENATGNKSSSTAGSGWALAASLTDCRGTVRGLSFAPSHFGLKLAAIASDSHLRIWDCLDATAALREWTLVEDVDLGVLGLAPSAGSSSSSTAHVYAGSSGISGAAGAGTGGAGGYDTGGSGTGSSYGGGSATGPSANAAFPSASSVASSANHGSSAAGSSVGYGGGNTRAGGTVESDGGWAVSWCPEHWWGERLAVSSGPNGVIRLFHFSQSRPWNNYLNLVPSRLAQSQGISTHYYTPSGSGFHPTSDEASHSAFSTSSSAGSSTDPSSRDGHYGSGNSTYTPPTSSLSFAPPSGRSYLLLAAGARDGRARVWRITPPPLSLPRSSAAGVAGQTSAGGGHDGEDDLADAEGDWTARLEVELEPAAGSEANPPGGGGGGNIGHAGGAANGNGRRGTGLGGAMSAVKVEWNILGTVLSTSGGEDGKVRVWKPTYTGQWRQVAVLSTQESSAPGSVQ
ncbi:hypothetical protein JCM10908_003152 [Rhodotorula pacifica]|uniref:WD40 repeat domain-containing protein n=1 Tax=Rhodotorula pacifica TaxID=1495444 RepID=UPI003174CEB5